MMKFVALGNVMMGDDGAAIHIAGLLEEKLSEMGIEVIYGETDIGYCITRISDGDSLILADAGYPGISPGKVSLLQMDEHFKPMCDKSQHGIGFCDILQLYYPGISCLIITIEAAKVEFCYGLSSILREKIVDISNVILELVMHIKLQGMDFYS